MRILPLVATGLLLCAPAYGDEETPPPAPPEKEEAKPTPPPRGREAPRSRNPMLERLARMDENGDGKVTRDEFRGPDRAWRRMDPDGDGEIDLKEAADRAQAFGRTGRRGNGGLSPDAMDGDKDGRISKAEFDAFFAKADQNGDGILDKAEWAAATSGRALADPAPQVGAKAPALTLQVMGSKTKTVDLHKPKRHTVLIFGSHT